MINLLKSRVKCKHYRLVKILYQRHEFSISGGLGLNQARSIGVFVRGEGGAQYIL